MTRSVQVYELMLYCLPLVGLDHHNVWTARPTTSLPYIGGGISLSVFPKDKTSGLIGFSSTQFLSWERHVGMVEIPIVWSSIFLDKEINPDLPEPDAVKRTVKRTL